MALQNYISIFYTII